MASTRRDKDQKCKFHLGADMKDSPHPHEKGVYDQMSGRIASIYDTVLDHVGYTPMVRMNKIAAQAGLECELVAKCEFFSAGGSVKDRIGKRMVEDAEREGRIKPGDTLIEPTSGNTGIGLALAAAVRGYKMIVTLPEKMSSEKVNTLRALGAQIIRTPTEAAHDSPESHIGVAKRLNSEIPSSHILDQYANPSNPLAHFDGTAEEILKQCGGKVDMIVVTAGTGGTVAGLASKLKRKLPHCQVVGVDPVGSILAQPDSLNGPISSYHVEGIGYDFIPRVLNREVVDQWIKTDDKESFAMARRLIREEGLLCGGSSGSVVVAALQAAKTLKKGQRCVVILPDSIRNYMTKFLSDEWMVENGFLDTLVADDQQPDEEKQWWCDQAVSDLPFHTPVTITPKLKCQQAVDIMADSGYDQLPVVAGEEVVGVVTSGNLTAKITSGHASPKDNVTKVMFKTFAVVSLQSKLWELSRALNHCHFVLVMAEQQQFTSSTENVKKSMCVGILSRIDLLNYIVKRSGSSSASTPRSPH